MTSSAKRRSGTIAATKWPMLPLNRQSFAALRQNRYAIKPEKPIKTP
jgi:hypothetical protein